MPDFAQIIADTAARYGVAPALAIEVATAESGMNANTPDSSAGAIGLFQLMPATAAQMGVDPRDPVQNIDGGVRYLRQMLARFSDVAAALGAYNWGPGAVSGAIAKYGPDWLSHAPSETRSYVARILGNLGTQYSVSAGPSAPPGQTDSTNSFTATDSGIGKYLLWGAIGIFA